MINKLIKEEKITPLFFIKLFREKYKGVEYFFLNWWCKIFADILQKNFGWEIFDYQWHYVVKINSIFYDVTWVLEVDEKKCSKPEECPEIFKTMENYTNILELCLYDFFKK